MENVRRAAAAAFAARHMPPPGSPPPQLVLRTEDLPEITSLIGALPYVFLFLGTLTDVVDHEDANYVLTCDVSYEQFPLFLLLGLTAGCASYGLSTTSDPAYALSGYAHTALTGFTFACFAKHLAKLGEVSGRRSTAYAALGVLPFVCLSVLETGRVRVTSCDFLFYAMLTLSLMPLSAIFMEWRRAQGNKYCRRLFFMFAASVVYVAALRPPHLCEPRKEFRQGSAVVFDLVILFLTSNFEGLC
jgi:hypothetical protein